MSSPAKENYYPAQSMPSDHEVMRPASPAPINHGRTGAAWVFFWAQVVAAVLVALSMTFGPAVLLWVGIGASVVGVITSLILRAAGLGQPTQNRPNPTL